MKKATVMNSVAIIAVMSAFDNTAGWKLDDKGAIVLVDGNPVYVNKDGKEQTVQSDTISRLNDENQTNRKRYETAETKLDKFKDIDPEKYRENIELLSKIDQKKLIDAGEVDKVKAEIGAQYDVQIGELKQDGASKDAKIDGMILDAAFGASKFIADRVSVPPSMFRGEFGKHFKVEDGKVAAYGADGNRLRSVKHIGESASFDEACEIFVEGYAGKDNIMKPIDASGSGSGGGGGGRGNGATIRVAEFDKMSPAQQAETAGKAQSGELTIVD